MSQETLAGDSSVEPFEGKDGAHGKIGAGPDPPLPRRGREPRRRTLRVVVWFPRGMPRAKGMNVQTTIESNPDGYQVEYTYFDPQPGPLEALLRDLFENHWDRFVFGPCIQGSVFELRVIGPRPRLGVLDGYLTVDFGDWHFHLCIGDHRGTPEKPTPTELARWRRVGKAAFFRYLNDEGAPTFWGIRLWNGRDEQMITFFLPNPYYDDEMKLQKPDWSRLALWNQLRQTHLQLPPQPAGPETRRDPHN